MPNQVELSEKQKKVLGFGCLGVVVLIVIVVIAVLVGGGGTTIATYEGMGDKQLTVTVPTSNGLVDFTVKHKADDPGFDSWGLYYPDENGTLIDANNGQEGSETVVYSHGPSLTQVTYVLEVDAAADCHWVIEVID